MRATSPADHVPTFARDRVVHAWLMLKGLSDAGDAAWTVAVAWTAVQIASPPTAGLVLAAGTLPRAFALLVGGVWADRFETRLVLLAVTAARISVLVMVVGFVTLGGVSVGLLVGAAVGFGLCDAIYEPAVATLGRQLVREHDLAAYAGAGQTASRLGTLAGAAAGGLLVATGGLVATALVTAAPYVLVLGFLGLALAVRFPLERTRCGTVVREVTLGLAHLRDDRSTRVLVLVLSGLNLALAPALGLGLPLRVDASGWGAATLGTLQAVVGLGGVCGAALLVRWRPRQEAATGLVCLVVQGLAIVGLAVPSFPATVVACLGIGLTSGSASALLSAVFVRSVASSFLGRLSSIQRLGDDVLMPAAMASFGALAAGAGVETALLVFGGTMAAVITAVLALRRDDLPGDPTGPAPPAAALPGRRGLRREGPRAAARPGRGTTG